MTYIIAGKLQNNIFIMADCIVKNVETKRETITNKIIKLYSSTDTFYTFTGVQFIDNCVKIYDYWMYKNKQKNDFIDSSDSINNLQAVIKRMIETFSEQKRMTLGLNRLFFC